MLKPKEERLADLNPQETSEWLEALEQVIEDGGPDRASYLLHQLSDRATRLGVRAPANVTTPYVNTIPVEEQVATPATVRWNGELKASSAGMRRPW